MMTKLHQAQLANITDDLVIKLETLYQYVLDEFDALSNKDIDRVVTLSSSKQAISAEIDKLNTRHTALLEEYQIADFSAWCNQNNKHPVTKNWKRVTDLLEQVASQNQVNGIIVENNRRSIEILIGLLRGQHQQEDAYNRSGTLARKHYSAELAQV